MCPNLVGMLVVPFLGCTRTGDVHAVITSRLGYHHMLYVRLSLKTVEMLPLVLNDAARLLGVRNGKHTVPALKE